jgi:hypothetical protein
MDSRCRALEYVHTEKTCNLFDGVPPQAKDIDTDTGIKKNASR